MSEYFSTQASIEARISSLRLKGFADFDNDDTVDEGTLTAAYKRARGLIRGSLEKVYGQTIIDTWTSDTVPELVGTISDDLCIYQLAIGNPMLMQACQLIRENALADLKMIASGEVSLYGTDGQTTDEFVVERSNSDFDPERELDDMTVRTTWVMPDVRELENY
jgi:phage gp36-like protein